MLHGILSPHSRCPACCEEAVRLGRHQEGDSHCPWVDELLAIFVASSGAERVQTSRMLSQMAPCRQEPEVFAAPVEGPITSGNAPVRTRHLRLL